MKISQVILGVVSLAAMAASPAWGQACPSGYVLAPGGNYCVVSSGANAAQGAQVAQQLAAGALTPAAIATFVAAGVLIATQSTTGTNGTTGTN